MQGESYLTANLRQIFNPHLVCRPEYPHHSSFHHLPNVALLCRCTNRCGRALPRHSSHFNRFDSQCRDRRTVFADRGRDFGCIRIGHGYRRWNYHQDPPCRRHSLFRSTWIPSHPYVIPKTFHLRRLIHFVSSESQLKEIAEALRNITPIEENRLPLLQLSVSLLMAGDNSLWSNLGKDIIGRSWETDLTFAIELSGSLCELGWGGWKSFGLPPVLKHTHRALETTPTKMLRLISWLVEDQKLTTVDAVWKQRAEGWIAKRLLAEKWQGSEEDVSNGCSESFHATEPYFQKGQPPARHPGSFTAPSKRKHDARWNFPASYGHN